MDEKMQPPESTERNWELGQLWRRKIKKNEEPQVSKQHLEFLDMFDAKFWLSSSFYLSFSVVGNYSCEIWRNFAQIRRCNARTFQNRFTIEIYGCFRGLAGALSETFIKNGCGFMFSRPFPADSMLQTHFWAQIWIHPVICMSLLWINRSFMVGLPQNLI